MSTQVPPLSLHRLTFVSTLHQDLVVDYLAHLRTRHTFRTFCRSSEVILAAPPEARRGQVYTGYCIHSTLLFLVARPLHNTCLSIGRPIADPRGEASGMQSSHQTSGQ